ncbi:MAG: hypothetical protein ABL949_00355 [Fimbriimonadaceae bacterium]
MWSRIFRQPRSSEPLQPRSTEQPTESAIPWKEVKTKQEVEELNNHFGGFHDACLKEALGWGGFNVSDELTMACGFWHNLRVLFQRQWKNPSAIEVVFLDLQEFRWSPAAPEYCGYTLDAGLYLQDGLIICSDVAVGHTPTLYIAAQSLWWRDASDWMGEEMRLGPNWEPPIQDPPRGHGYGKGQ